MIAVPAWIFGMNLAVIAATPEYQPDQTNEKRRKTHCHRLVLLGGHCLCRPTYAVSSGDMVNAGERFETRISLC